MTKTLPVTTIGGYLGSGKTTLVNHLLRNANGLRLAILVNEFGELAIDEDLIEATGDDIISIAGGCVCCSFGSDLSGALMDLSHMTPMPDHILIESSGVAIPGSIVASIDLLDGFSSDGIVVLADVETIRQHAQNQYMGDTVIRQLNDANIVLLNKIDLVNSDTLATTKQWLRNKFPHLRIVETLHGSVPPETVLESFLAKNHVPGPHQEASNLDMITLQPEGPLDIENLAKSLGDPTNGVIRAKGFATSLENKKMLIQVVGNRWQISKADQELADGIVCLGFKGTLQNKSLLRLLKS